jgi:hypothetical protein
VESHAPIVRPLAGHVTGRDTAAPSDDTSANDFDRERSTSIPAALFGVLGKEPRWVDVSTLRPVELSLPVPAFRDRAILYRAA